MLNEERIKEEVRRKQIRLHMEGALTARDKVGVQDFVLLDAYTSESAFLDNLRKRFSENLIYTYIGTLLVSVNPYQELGIYTVSQMELYQGVNFFELPPHVYAVADNAYRMMCSELNNHFILISGESGAGKTEASKKILQYFAVTCPMTESLQIARDRLLLSNPVLEAFGNAKTLRNDNSSRFGKYMDIQFDFKGIPVGGRIISYLIEKSRVVHQNHGERNFHIFYQLLEGGEEERLAYLGLERDPQLYKYLSQGHCAKEPSINDKNNWKTVSNAFSIIDFTEDDLENLFGIIASVLHLGNICFQENEQGCATIPDTHEIKWIAKVMDGPLQKRVGGCSYRGGEDFPGETVIGLLDIYGFEVFDKNGRKLAGPKGRKRIGWMEFRLFHYAGEVTYCTKGFLEKNNDLLYRHLKEVLCRSKNRILKECFLVAELENRRRPPTVGTQFKNSLSSLLEILISKEPSYIRCIKPNERKEPSKFDDFLIRHQVKYLGLMEHLRVRRAGFAYRRKYEHFLQRYKSLCPDTWPRWHGPPAEGVERLIKYIGYKPEEYKLGRFLTGFINRNKPLCPDNEEFIVFVRKNYILNLQYHVPKNVLDKSWLRPPGILENASELLRKMCMRNLVRKYCRGITAERKALVGTRCVGRWRDGGGRGVPALPIISPMQQKVVTSDIFRGKKEGYAESLNQPFAHSRIDEGDINPKVLQLIGSEKIQYGIPVIKYDRKGFKTRQRQLILTQKAAYVVELAKIKQKIEYSTLKGVSTSSLSDGIFVIHVSPEDNKQKGDAVLQCEHIFEAVTKLAMLVKKENIVNVVQGRKHQH
ncbi:Unconventional myosin-Ih [Camelus dromedarius]|uniref:Unconventional myosin-Ih n=1 Tax=Camelus dromedarius TaxID=9838 RepID=A0A5N4C9G8_CAMDR|nr:Unconventional myosin-Ih [Camelus dromedarius]